MDTMKQQQPEQTEASEFERFRHKVIDDFHFELKFLTDDKEPEANATIIGDMVKNLRKHQATLTKQVIPDWGQQIRTLADAYAPKPPIDWIVEDLIIKPGIAMFFGPSEHMKSLLTADLCICVAAGIGWLKPIQGSHSSALKVTQQKVLWLDLEMGERESDDRFAALARSRDLPEDLPLQYITLPRPRFYSDQEESIELLAKFVDDNGIGLVVIDSLNAATFDPKEENFASMGTTFSNIRFGLTELTGCTCIMIHHARKGSGNFKGDIAETIRGSGAIKAALDCGIAVTKDSSDPNTLELEHAKARRWKMPKFAARLSYDHYPDTHDLREASFAGILPEGRHDKTDMFIAESVSQFPGELNQTALVAIVMDYTGKGATYVKGRVKIMETKGEKIRGEKNGPRNATLYYPVG